MKEYSLNVIFFFIKFLYQKEAEAIYDLKSEFLSNNQDNKLILFQFLTESNTVCLINCKGDLNLLNILTKTVNKLI